MEVHSIIWDSGFGNSMYKSSKKYRQLSKIFFIYVIIWYQKFKRSPQTFEYLAGGVSL